MEENFAYKQHHFRLRRSEAKVISCEISSSSAADGLLKL